MDSTSSKIVRTVSSTVESLSAPLQTASWQQAGTNVILRCSARDSLSHRWIVVMLGTARSTHVGRCFGLTVVERHGCRPHSGPCVVFPALCSRDFSPVFLFCFFFFVIHIYSLSFVLCPCSSLSYFISFLARTAKRSVFSLLSSLHAFSCFQQLSLTNNTTPITNAGSAGADVRVARTAAA